ncbi:HK97-gp10 family putative phage morphogenesis protein [Sulfuriferula sp.]|uniref:HK97-gp10 family putative phage morphogenesis protein n=1 Tax=Sulfuriferula sp. TaxID=2025307 RepID=UPI00272F0D8F|nr:HK97-gp10 family putative phage morphogenesis protein [Sulfuriferula sp.]MDP2026446.1 HK97 gp10 family phage protein [Sulfuriferula sp.]
MAELQHVSGLKALNDALKELPERIARNALSASVYAAAKVIRDEAKVLAPHYTGPVAQGHPPPGTLNRSIIMKHIAEKSSKYQQTYYVVVRHGKKYQKQGKKGTLSQDAFYWRWVEFGRTNMAAKPFMRPAFEAKKQSALQALQDKLASRIAEEAGKLAK